VLSDFLWSGGKFPLVDDAAIMIDDAQIDTAGRNIESDIVAVRHAESLQTEDRHFS